MDGAIGVKEAAKALGVHVNTLKRIHPSELPYFTLGGRRDRRYSPADIAAYILRHRVDR